jgi:hypothetical protein
VRHERCRAKNNKNNLIKAFRYDPHNPNEGAIQDWCDPAPRRKLQFAATCRTDDRRLLAALPAGV